MQLDTKYYTLILKIYNLCRIVVKFKQGDKIIQATKIYKNDNDIFYRVVLNFIQGDTKCYTGWYWSLYR